MPMTSPLDQLILSVNLDDFKTSILSPRDKSAPKSF